MKTKPQYILISRDAVPAKARFDVPRRNQGQIVEVAYGGFDRGEHDSGDLFKRVTDRASGKVSYFKLA